MSKLTPTVAEIEALQGKVPEGPVVIVNLLKLRDGPDGVAAYRRYLEDGAAAANADAEIVYAGAAIADVGGGEDWDYVIIVRYRDYAGFARTVTHPAYQGDAASHRPDALARTIMLVTTPASLGDYFGSAA